VDAANALVSAEVHGKSYPEDEVFEYPTDNGPVK
jgi:hypothetical protein